MPALALIAACAGDTQPAAASNASGEPGMNDAAFWGLIGKLDWARTGDDDAVCEPVVAALATQALSAIEAFEDALATKLHALDTEAIAGQIGEDSYTGPDEHFSVDTFLYARCVVVANGQSMFDSVLRDARQMPKDMEFEALLGIGASAFQRKTGQEFKFTPRISYETFSNKAGWRRR